MHAHTTADSKWRMISQTAEYALSVVLYLADRPGAEPTSATEAAEGLGVPERYLARGAQGGFRLARDPGELTLAAVVAPFDAVGEPPQCLLRKERCGEGQSCIAHRHWHDLATRVRLFFQETTIADLLGAAELPAAAGGLCDETRSSIR
jgi:DNA-binding IscR family transcriptional regulator